MAVYITDIGRQLQKYGWTVGENPAFGTGRVGKHAPGSHHYSGNAIDVTRQGADMSAAYAGGPKRSWKDLTGDLKYRAKKTGLFTEVLGPGDAGHDTHTHLALKGPVNTTPEMMQWVATGRYKTPEGKLTDVMPGATTSTQTVSPEASTDTLLKALFQLGEKEKQASLADQLIGGAVAQAIQKRLAPQSGVAALSQINPYEDALLDPSKVLG
jgi:hypothetical protein